MPRATASRHTVGAPPGSDSSIWSPFCLCLTPHLGAIALLTCSSLCCSCFSWSPTPKPTEAVESQSGRKQFLQLAMHKPYRCGSCYLLSTYSRSVSEVVGVCATGFSPGTNATELAAASPADTTYCARLLVRASVVLRVIEHRSAEEVAAEELEARARQPLRQDLNQVDGPWSPRRRTPAP